jgi:hypothetical protein
MSKEALTEQQKETQKQADIMASGEYELEVPITFDGKTYTWVKKKLDAKPIHRIKAVKFSQDEFGTDKGDGVICSSVSQLFVFGNKKDGQFVDESRISAAAVAEEMDYNDFMYVSILLGKRVASSTPTPSS